MYQKQVEPTVIDHGFFPPPKASLKSLLGHPDSYSWSFDLKFYYLGDLGCPHYCLMIAACLFWHWEGCLLVHIMEKDRGDRANQFFGGLGSFLRKCIFKILSVGPIPNHIAFIMDGNRRYAKKQGMEEGAGHKEGFLALMKILSYCYELGVKYLTVYAFSIENFKRKPEEVQCLMDLMLEKIGELLKEESVVNQYGIRLYFIGNLKLLSEPVRVAAEKAMAATAKNTKTVLLICVAYTSYDEIVHAVQESCKEKRNEIETLYASKVSNGVTEGVEEGEINGTTEHDVQGWGVVCGGGEVQKEVDTY
ncbi:dehydrodolichyl diphosphate synthase 6 [Quercus suber]|uniref:Alkyl transferase n=2 Tax=Quercus suber TaxID=58331 RepID=A0AAW0LRN7_QUESU